jgi:hypothetical protein
MSEIISRPIGTLRQRMLDEMRTRQFAEKTQNDYIRHGKALTDLIDRSPATATPDDLRAPQVRQRQEGVQPPTMNSGVSALRFFFTFVCDAPSGARRRHSRHPGDGWPCQARHDGPLRPRCEPHPARGDEPARSTDDGEAAGLSRHRGPSIARGRGCPPQLVALGVTPTGDERHRELQDRGSRRPSRAL